MIRKSLLNSGIRCSKETFEIALAITTLDIKANNIALGKPITYKEMIAVLIRAIKIVEKVNGERDIGELFDRLPEPEYDLNAEIEWHNYRAELMQEIKKAGTNQQK